MNKFNKYKTVQNIIIKPTRNKGVNDFTLVMKGFSKILPRKE